MKIASAESLIMTSVLKNSFVVCLCLSTLSNPTISSLSFNSDFGNSTNSVLPAALNHSVKEYGISKTIYANVKSAGLPRRRDKRFIFSVHGENVHLVTLKLVQKWLYPQQTQSAKSIRIGDEPSQLCRLWPESKVPFEIDFSLEDKIIKSIEDAIIELHNKTCIQWIPRQSEGAFVYFVKAEDSSSNKTEECYTGGRRVAIIGEGFTTKEIMRQMAYILGFGDEHRRKDRDDFVKVRRDNCTMGEKYPHYNGGGFYDYSSVMHPRCDKKSCLMAKGSAAVHCGITTGLSYLDAEKLNGMYQCGGCHSLFFQFPERIDLSVKELVPVFDNAYEDRKHICRVNVHGTRIRIGRGNVKKRECHYFNKFEPEVATENVQFLTKSYKAKVQWVSRKGDFPFNAIPGGGNFFSDHLLYIYRCPEEPQWGDTVVPGASLRKHTTMDMFKKGFNRFNRCSSFDILTCS